MLMGLLCAEPCHTIASGNSNDPVVLVCGCDPVLCDTLYVEHDLLTSDPVVYIDAAYLRIEASGSLTGSSEVNITSTVDNFGLIDESWLDFFTQGYMRNTGVLVADFFIMSKDSCVNYGTFTVNDTSINGFGSSFYNYALMEVAVFGNLGFFDNVSVGSSLTAQYIEGRSLANYGTIYVSGAIRLSSIIENTGSIVTATLQVSTGLETHGTITCSDSLITGLPGLGSAEISKIFGGALVETNVFFNPEPCRVFGSGTMCISGESTNEGSIEGTLRICDTSPTSTEWPYLDVNTGIVESSVIVCQPGLCSVGIDEVSNAPQLLVYPNPSSDAVVFELGSSSVKSIELVDGSGRMIRIMQGPFYEQVTLQRMALEAGCYFVLAYDAQGSLTGRSQLVFINN